MEIEAPIRTQEAQSENNAQAVALSESSRNTANECGICDMRFCYWCITDLHHMINIFQPFVCLQLNTWQNRLHSFVDDHHYTHRAIFCIALNIVRSASLNFIDSTANGFSQPFSSSSFSNL